MDVLFYGVGAVFTLIALVCNIIILIHAFKKSVGTGFLCLCVPCYILYYMFSEFEHPQKTLIITGSIGGNIIGNVLLRVPMMMHPTPTYGSPYGNTYP